jgi:hypothetical protein
MRSAACSQPIRAAQEVAGRRAKGLRLGHTPATCIAGQSTATDGALGHSDARTAMPARRSTTISMTRSSLRPRCGWKPTSHPLLAAA